MKNKNSNIGKSLHKLTGNDERYSCPLFDEKKIDQGECADILMYLNDYPNGKSYDDYLIDRIVKNNDCDVNLIKKLCFNHALFKGYIKKHLYDQAMNREDDEGEIRSYFSAFIVSTINDDNSWDPLFETL